MVRQQEIEGLVNTAFSCDFLEVLNESHKHSVPPNSETHFKVTAVSDDFIGKSKVARHQSVYSILNSLLQQGLHALALHTYTTSEWAEIKSSSPESPNCMGGSKSA